MQISTIIMESIMEVPEKKLKNITAFIWSSNSTPWHMYEIM
jgi:hypothetical protein